MNNPCGLCDYYAIDKALELSSVSYYRWKISRERLEEIEHFFRPYLEDPKFSLIPRFNGSYISFRYCGLEVLRLTKESQFKIKIGEQNRQIRSLPQIVSLRSLEEIKLIMNRIKVFLEEHRVNYQTMINKPKQDKYIPGFSLEHWLESLILANNRIGIMARKELGINSDLKKVVSQVPIILRPLKAGHRHRHRHIDLFSINQDGRVVVVELKKDDDFKKAKTELEEYTDWFLIRGREYHAERGNPEAMVKEHYIPKPDVQFDSSADGIEAIAVLKGQHLKAEQRLNNGVPLKVVELSETWLSEDGPIFKVTA